MSDTETIFQRQALEVLPLALRQNDLNDIVYEFPNCDDAAYGATSYVDFLRFAKQLENNACSHSCRRR